eukprot:403369481
MFKRNLKLDLLVSDDDISSQNKSDLQQQVQPDSSTDQIEQLNVDSQNNTQILNQQQDQTVQKQKNPIQMKKPQLQIQNVDSNDEEDDQDMINKQSIEINQNAYQSQQSHNSISQTHQKQDKNIPQAQNHKNLMLDQSIDHNSMSCELNSEGLKVMREDYEIGKEGMRNLSTGQIIVGNLAKEDLEMKEVIGNGASGYVYKAIYKPRGRVLAIKSINAFDKGKRHQLINDLRSLQKNSCPFLVEFCGALYEEGAVKVALEYMDMGSLKSIIKLANKNPDWEKGQPLIPEAVMAKLAQQILCGLSYLNICKKQIHRDIKPDNILVNQQGIAKLTDFGIATELDETGGLAKTFVGTLTYMSPERMEGETYSAKGDIWSLGIVLVEMISGEFPYPETRDFLEMHNLIANKPSPNVPNSANFTPELRDFIEKCLIKDPKERASSIQLMAHPWILRYSQSDAKVAQYFQTLRSYDQN